MTFVSKNFRPKEQYGHDDLLHMSTLSVESFLNNLEYRYKIGIYYTSIGDVCLSVNPNRTKMSIYGSEFIEMYHKEKIFNLPPHIYAIASEAHRQIIEQQNDCSIIITGESGSGKTEASKLVLLYLSNVIKQNRKIFIVEDVIIKSNCILEAFGNAKTICNHNSSRFGKYTEISFVYDKPRKTFQSNNVNIEYSYGTIHDYLLEKCRVIGQQDGERNFHAFYYLLSILNSNKYGQLFGEIKMSDNIESYRYLNKSSKVTQEDNEKFDQVYNSMIEVGFTMNEIESIYKVLASILILGNIDFKLSDERKSFDFKNLITIESRKHLDDFCQLLSLDADKTLKTLCSRMIRTPFDSICKPYDNSEANFGRDAMAKAIYQKLFEYILKRINQFLKINKSDNDCFKNFNTIGILDIYGFEVFHQTANGFEQFLINYCNEKLHQLFIDLIMRKEQRFYEQEDIDWKMIVYEDNIAICQLMDQTHQGIFAILDEAFTSGQKFTDQYLLKIFNEKFSSNQYFGSKTTNPLLKDLQPETDFIIRHFSGDVRYCIEGFIEKNSDQLYYDYCQLLLTINNPLIREMLQIEQPLNKRPVTASFQFRKSMQSLLTKLSNQKQFYVRCIKPTDNLKCNVNHFDTDKVRHQIQYLGLVENARIRRAGFWRQFPYRIFVQRYKMLLDKEHGNLSNESFDNGHLRDHFKPICKKILETIPFVQNEDPEKFAFGKTIFFLRDPQIVESLEKKRFQFLEQIILNIQNAGRRFLAMKRLQRLEQSKFIFEMMIHVKKLNAVDLFIEKLDHYLKNSMDQNSPIICDLKPIFNEVFQGILFRNNELYKKFLPEFLTYLNQWLIFMRFPYHFWNEKTIRKKAFEIFQGNKLEWGNERPKWLANYLIECSETEQYLSFRKLFQQNPDFQMIIFSSYILKMKNSSKMNQIVALVMNRKIIFNVNIDNMTYKPWIHLEDIDSVSVTTGSDQLVVLHQKFPHQDLVFAFCSLKSKSIGISSARMAFESDPSIVNETRVGEFVASLSQQYESILGSKLMVNFKDNIELNFNDQMKNYSIEAMKIGSEKFGQYFDDSGKLSQKIANFFIIKNIYNFYWCLSRYKKVSTKNKRQLTRKLEFRKLPERGTVALIYNI